MADVVVVCSDTTSVGDQSENESPIIARPPRPVRTVSIKEKAKNARDLVKGQEKLLSILQDLNYDLAKMDREANRIREDVIRSKQMVRLVVDKNESHHTPLASSSFRPTHSSSLMPYKNRDNELSMHYLNKIPTLSPRSSMNSRYRSSSRNRDLDDIRQRVASFGRRIRRDSERSSRRGSRSFSTAEDQYSGTESDVESSSSRYWTQSSGRSVTGGNSTYYGSDDSLSDDAGSSTESNATIYSNRSVSIHTDESSFFYKQKQKL